MMGRQQSGYVYKKGGSWFVRFYDTVLEGGKPVRKQIARRIASVSDYRSKKSILPLVTELLLPINTGSQPVESTIPLQEFVGFVYLPFARVQHRPSTVASYEAMWKEHLAPRCGSVRVRDFRTVDGEHLLANIARQTALSRNSLKHLKSMLSAVFKHAKRQGLLNGVNPMTDVSVPKAKESEETYAYSLSEITRMISVLPEPASTIVAVAGLTGMRKGEIRGLRWDDLQDGSLYVRQSVWNGHTTEPKTKQSKAPIPIIQPLAQMLAKHRERMGVNPAVHVFCSASGKPLSLDNLALRTIRPILQKVGLEWHGWHGFRRGLATNLYSIGIQDKVIQQILRHSSIAVTQNCYIKAVDGAAVDAMKTLECVCGDLGAFTSPALPM